MIFCKKLFKDNFTSKNCSFFYLLLTFIECVFDNLFYYYLLVSYIEPNQGVNSISCSGNNSRTKNIKITCKDISVFYIAVPSTSCIIQRNRPQKPNNLVRFKTLARVIKHPNCRWQKNTQHLQNRTFQPISTLSLLHLHVLNN